MALPFVATLILASLGIVNTVYLSIHRLRGTLVKCLFFPPEWCAKVQRSSQSVTFGIPNAFAGLAFYLAIFVLAWLNWGSLVPLWPLAVVVSVGFAFGLYFTFIQAFVLRAFCTWCVASAVDLALLFALLFFW